MTGDAEVTVECNPEDASAARFARWRQAGVTRVSFGVQSMVPHVLESLGRRHGTTQVARAVALAGEAGFAIGERGPHLGGGGRDRRRCGRPPSTPCSPSSPDPGT